jgi:hypothetical protein
MARLDWALKNFVGFGPGQGSRSRILVSPKEKDKWIKQPKKWFKPKWVGPGTMSVAGVGTGFKPSDTKKPGTAGPGSMTKVGLGTGMNFKGTERVTD